MAKITDFIKFVCINLMHLFVCATVVMLCIYLMSVIYKLILHTGMFSDMIAYLKDIAI